MIEAYAFLVAFAVQVLVVSVLHPAWFTAYARAKAEAQFPGWDRKSRERFLSLFRAVNAGIAVLGLALLGWLLNHMRSPDWDLTRVMRLLADYVQVQLLPFVLASLIGAWFKRKALTRSPREGRRTASLQRRGLFDIVSPFIVFLAGAGYVLFAACIIAIQQHAVARFPGYSLLCMVTLFFALNAFCLYWVLYRRKKWPLETRTYRAQAVEVQVKIIFYVSIAVIVFMSLITTIRVLDILRWAPFAVSVFVVIIMLFTAMMLFTLRRQAEADRTGSRAF